MVDRTSIPVVPVHRPDLTQATYHMDAATFGAFMRLYLIHFDHPAGIEDDDVLLMRYSNCTGKVWRRIRKRVLEPFQRYQDKTSGLFFLRLQQVVEGIHDIELKSSNARAKVMKRWKTCDTDVSPQQYHSNTTPSPRGVSITQTPEKPPTRKRARAEAPPGGGGLSQSDPGGGGGGFRIRGQLSAGDEDRARALCREADRDWDAVCQAYDEGINSGDRERPKYPSKAFVGWVPKYLDGIRRKQNGLPPVKAAAEGNAKAMALADEVNQRLDFRMPVEHAGHGAKAGMLEFEREVRNGREPLPSDPLSAYAGWLIRRDVAAAKRKAAA